MCPKLGGQSELAASYNYIIKHIHLVKNITGDWFYLLLFTKHK